MKYFKKGLSSQHPLDSTQLSLTSVPEDSMSFSGLCWGLAQLRASLPETSSHEVRENSFLSTPPRPGKHVVTPSGMEMTSQSIPIGDFLLSLPVTIELFNRPTNFQKHYKIHLSKLKPFTSPSYPWESSSQEAVVKYSETSKTAS